MDQVASVTARGYYSLVRYRPDPIREEFKNIGILLLEENGSFYGLRTLRPGAIGKTVEDQGLLTAVITAVEDQLRSRSDALSQLRELAATYSHSILFSDPVPAMSTMGWRPLLDSLYAALVAPKTHPPVGFTKGHVLDRLHKWFVENGSRFEIGGRFDGYSFDAVLRTPENVTYAIQVSSFAARQIDTVRLELEVGHFLFAAPRIHAKCIGVIQPASATATEEIQRLQYRVASWYNDAGVPVLSPAAVRTSIAPVIKGVSPLPVQLALMT